MVLGHRIGTVFTEWMANFCAVNNTEKSLVVNHEFLKTHRLNFLLNSSKLLITWEIYYRQNTTTLIKHLYLSSQMTESP